jgi:2-polyprenyl-6-methoxyphenol hydroxylase-like FAD-dependent oxidoreductase
LLALSLTVQKIPVRIVDRLSVPGTTSRAIGVQARTLELYNQFGLTQQLIENGVQVAAGNIWVNGNKVARIPIKDIGEGQSPYPYLLMYPQDEHEKLLIEKLGELGVTVERPVELLRFVDCGTHVEATLKHADGREETIVVQYLAGCDGASSIVRESLLGREGFAGGTYSQTFYVADVQISGPVDDDEVHVDVADKDFVAIFPLKGRGKARLIGAVHPTQQTLGRALTFEDISTHALQQIKVTVDRVNWFSTYRVHHRVASRFKIGRAFLLGDAAHIHSPAGAQGMNTGLGDAINLAWKLAHVLKGQAPEALLDSYEVERIRFAKRLVRTTDQVFTLATDPRKFIQAARVNLVPTLVPAAFQLAPTRQFLFKTVSQIGIHYRHCSFNEGQAGPIHGGDRLPFFRFEGGATNFDPLKTIEWQVHIYGEAGDEIREACSALKIGLHTFPWERGMFAAHLRRNAMYLLRPDTYIAWISKTQSAQALRGFLESRQISPFV